MVLLSRCGLAILAATACIMQFAAPVAAEQVPATVSKSAVVLVPGTLTGLGSMGPRGARRFCNPRAVGLAEWRAAEIIRMLNLDDAQKAALKGLSESSVKALELFASACQKPGADKPPLAVMETRVETMLQVLRIVRPAYDKLYATLSDTQKKRLDALGPGRHGWQW